jgi:dTDP-4-dehydrorhamnose reductase
MNAGQVNVVVLGSTGMLGHTVVECLSADPRFRVIGCSRRGTACHINALDFVLNVPEETDYVINCIGIIPQAQNHNRKEMFHVNAFFPWRLQVLCASMGIKLIQVSTDCVFSGLVGGYAETDDTDEAGDYGFSKSLGEPEGAMVLRTSIIGYEIDTQRSLLGWALANKGKQVTGYTNHLWNGLTAREYARICADIMVGDLWQPGINHIHSTTVSKHDLLCKLNDALDLNLKIIAISPKPVNRTLTTVRPLNGLLNVPDIDTMIANLR